ncbi:hypothetical protein BABINDRAFT_163690 [Babjeviella inositovora NRRL Y-12698]|uniref:DASH complex subunit SPC34 n=1 Tax=Babjeviella inositovora NRRL Y-12698 TaxID=984486 RepID=A0A1E3QHL0_9ASCO|nr:uncharacterized protein BABINDRAFT_163690 [Babjeviella inositovora NRRL Y-12698]ODQ77179.1 hypothetical protein BABINDRAFT_163690 [Babjeviella inositovora NRRL Y-12698]
MSSTTSFHIAQINKSAESLKTLDFRKPGIFTNALLLHPEITSLIRDADEHERALYRLNGSKEMERVDGSCVYAPRKSDEEGNKADESMLIATDNSQYNNYVQTQLLGDLYTQHSSSHSRTTVQTPLLRTTPAAVSKGVYDRDTEEVTEEFDSLCSTIALLVAKFPVEGIAEKVRAYKRDYAALTGEISHYDTLVNRQREQLAGFTAEVEDEAEEETVSVEELIRIEEEEIAELEAQLRVKQR